ncbi:class I SAM-dependent RNA methyltransferase [Candidatus Saccharibacteria bacterium]|nr:class I SAM-dependent RNA methyltransferase [Candidatus Saccharibacteria bacterium]
MKRYETISSEKVKIDKLIPGGQGIGTLADGKKVMFWNALPSETVTEFTPTKIKSRYIEAIATEITDPSPHRIEPRDACYLSTSPWQIMDYIYELEQKSLLIEEVFQTCFFGHACAHLSSQGALRYLPSLRSRVPRGERRPSENVLKNTFEKPLTDNNDFYYRNKMEYSLYWDNDENKIRLAFHQRGSHYKIPITQSSLERPEIFQKATEIINNLNSQHAEARRYQSLLLRCNQQGIVSGGLYENGQPHPNFKPLTDTILGYEYSYSPNGFFQINLPVYEMALTEIKKHITTDKVLDLYAGVGTIGLSVARDHQLTLVEVDKSAYTELVKNCQASNAYAVLSKSEDALDFITSDTTVILDPPRAGCHTKLLDKLLEVNPPTIIYLSCNPATQARDIAILQQKYHITHLQPFNFFPRTPHIENLIILEQQ